MRPPPISTLFPYTTLFRSPIRRVSTITQTEAAMQMSVRILLRFCLGISGTGAYRSEEHTSELQSHSDLVCRLLLEKKNIRHGKLSGTSWAHRSQLRSTCHI